MKHVTASPNCAIYTARYVPPGSSARTCQTVSPKPCNIFALSCFCPICAWYKAKPSFCRTVGGKSVSRSSESTSQTNLRGRSGFSGTTLIVCQNWHKAVVENCSTYCSNSQHESLRFAQRIEN